MDQEALLHELYVWKLSKEISQKYDSITCNVHFEKQGRIVGEIDIVATKGTKIDVYEVKHSNRITKARKQLTIAKKHYGSKLRYCFFYCGSSDILKIVKL